MQTESMKLADIIKEIYRDNRKTIRLYLGFFLVVSVFLCGSGVFAEEITSLDKSDLGGAFTQSLNSALVFLFPGIEPCIGFGITTVLAILGDYSLLPGGMGGLDFGLIGYSWVFRIIILIWCLLSVLPRYFGVTRIGGLCIERINDKYVGTVVIVLNMFPKLLQYSPAESAMAAGLGHKSVLAATVLPIGVLYSVTMFLGLCLMLVMYYVIRLFMMFIDIVILPVNCLIPGTSLLVETAKFIFCIFMAVNSIFNPVLFIIFYAIILILSVIFFKRAYLAVKYFKNVYMIPMWHKISGKNITPARVPEKLPGRMTQYLAGKPYRAVIPIYATKISASIAEIEKYEPLWMVIGMNNEIILCKPYKKSVFEMPLISTPQSKLFINNSLLYIEIFGVYNEQSINGRIRNNQKTCQYVISKDYLPLYNEIWYGTGLWEFTQYLNSVGKNNSKWGMFKNLI